jgi:hypothetical protein
MAIADSAAGEFIVILERRSGTESVRGTGGALTRANAIFEMLIAVVFAARVVVVLLVAALATLFGAAGRPVVRTIPPVLIRHAIRVGHLSILPFIRCSRTPLGLGDVDLSARSGESAIGVPDVFVQGRSSSVPVSFSRHASRRTTTWWMSIFLYE